MKNEDTYAWVKTIWLLMSVIAVVMLSSTAVAETRMDRTKFWPVTSRNGVFTAQTTTWQTCSRMALLTGLPI